MKVELPEITPDTSLISVGEGQFDYDVIVVGGGNAALCAAIRAAEAGASPQSLSGHQGSIGAVIRVTLATFDASMVLPRVS